VFSIAGYFSLAIIFAFFIIRLCGNPWKARRRVEWHGFIPVELKGHGNDKKNPAKFNVDGSDNKSRLFVFGK
jgi:hypothetical protein